MSSSSYLSDLTVFVITTGEDTYDESLEALQNQDCAFKIEEIRNVYPMSRAFQAMPDRCRTRYFVQADADFVLRPNTIRVLYDAIRKSGWRTYRVHAQLYEEGFGLGDAVKCWRRSIFRLFKFRDARTVDRDFHHRVARWGFRTEIVEGVLGVHRPRHSPFSEYLKAKSDVEKWRFLRRPVEQYALGTLENMLAQYPESQHQVLGALLGTLTGMDRVRRSKDVRVEKDRYQQVLELLGQDHELSAVRSGLGGLEEDLKGLFARCYQDIDGRGYTHQRQLASETLALYSQRPSDGDAARRLMEITAH